MDANRSAKDFYSVLGVAKDATAEAIKKAYRKLARQYHPDTAGGDTEAEGRFKEIAEAYEVLSDPEKRRAYDQERELSVSPFAGFSLRDGVFRPDGPAISDLFSDFGIDPRVRRTGFAPTPPPLQATAQLTFDQAVNGVTLTAETPSGSVQVPVPAGVEDGMVLRVPVRQEGQALPRDLLLSVEVESHPWFGREGVNLLLSLPVTFDELALGATVEVPLYPSGSVKLKIPAGTPNGRVFRVAGKGLTGPRGEVGDLLATVKVEVPKSLPPEGVAAVEAYRKATSIHTPRAKFFS